MKDGRPFTPLGQARPPLDYPGLGRKQEILDIRG